MDDRKRTNALLSLERSREENHTVAASHGSVALSLPLASFSGFLGCLRQVNRRGERALSMIGMGLSLDSRKDLC